MSERKSEIEKFNRRNNFRLWSIKMRALLTTKALDGEYESLIIMKAFERVELMERANSIILLNLSDEVLIEVAEKKDAVALWAKL
ncbi:hypothetical protein EUGRSUZ_D01009 [Eucalyptus grandis]|uniref:Uncharacterized protein n=2 Tax=Eucalyptus grandis TaxID=71139 RepID=A0ACC3L5H8_EUCGR|nr:hypothetical protein EUGRSUZ_D01009 [Eucalyptus grandis]